MASMSVRVGLGLLLAGVLLSMLGACAWVVFILYLHQRLPWMAWPLGVALGWTFARGDRPGALMHAAGATAALATLLATLWVALLVAVATIAGSMGFGLMAAAHTAGLAMLLSLVWMGQSTPTIAWALSGAVLAALVAWMRSRTLMRRAS